MASSILRLPREQANERADSETRYRLLYESLGRRDAIMLKATASFTSEKALDRAAELCRFYFPELDNADAKAFLQWLNEPRVWNELLVGAMS